MRSPKSILAVLTATVAAAVCTLSTQGAMAQSSEPTIISRGAQEQLHDRQRQLERLADRDRIEQQRRSRQPTPEFIQRSAQAAATAAGLSCQVSESSLLGKTDDDSDLYEVACAGGSGYIVQNSTPPQSFDCLLLAAQADKVRAEGGEVAAGTTCALPGNQNTMTVFAGYARAAGVPCEIDAAKVVGKTSAGNTVYEVGCPGADGWHIEQLAQGWKKTDCLEVMSTNLTCQFTTAEEQVAGFKPKLAGTDIDDCDAQRIHLLGQNDNGRFIEVKCASGEGYVTRMKDDAVAQVYPCALAVRIGGGCTMTPVAASSEQQ